MYEEMGKEFLQFFENNEHAFGEFKEERDKILRKVNNPSEKPVLHQKCAQANKKNPKRRNKSSIPVKISKQLSIIEEEPEQTSPVKLPNIDQTIERKI